MDGAFTDPSATERLQAADVSRLLTLSVALQPIGHLHSYAKISWIDA
jgi:hypothetical protein